jgi:hypothetical protein
MANANEVQAFLHDFKYKMDFWGIVFRDDRPKNLQALLSLDITTAKRREMIRSLVVADYCDGTIEDKLNQLSEMWVFGKNVKSKEIYIKITLGLESRPVICISFHEAERKMKFPFKQ